MFLPLPALRAGAGAGSRRGERLCRTGPSDSAGPPPAETSDPDIKRFYPDLLWCTMKTIAWIGVTLLARKDQKLATRRDDEAASRDRESSNPHPHPAGPILHVK